jgi:hypothetical protein
MLALFRLDEVCTIFVNQRIENSKPWRPPFALS